MLERLKQIGPYYVNVISLVYFILPENIALLTMGW